MGLLFVYAGLVSVVVDTVMLSVFVAARYEDFLDRNTTLSAQYLYESGWMNIFLTALRVGLFSALVRRGGHCGFRMSSSGRKEAEEGECGGGKGVPFLCKAPQLPILWLGLNAALLVAEALDLVAAPHSTTQHQRKLWKLVGCGAVSVAAQSYCIRSLRKAAAALSANVHERHIFLESIFGIGNDENAAALLSADMLEGGRSASRGGRANNHDDGDGDGGGGGGLRASEAERRRVDNQSRRAGRGSGGGGSLEDLVETVPEWLQRVRERVEEARSGWRSKLDALGRELSRYRYGNGSAAGSGGGGSNIASTRRVLSFRIASADPTNPTELLLSEDDALIATLVSLFAARDAAVASVRLKELDAHEPTRLRFWIPQLCTFLLYGAEGVVAMEVQEWLLRKCSGSDATTTSSSSFFGGDEEDGSMDGSAGVHLAHAMYWFLSAHALLDRSASSSISAMAASSESTSSIESQSAKRGPQLKTGAVRSRAGKGAVAALIAEVRRRAFPSAFRLLNGTAIFADEADLLAIKGGARQSTGSSGRGNDGGDNGEGVGEDEEDDDNLAPRGSSRSRLSTGSLDGGGAPLLLHPDDVLFDRVLAPTSFLPPPHAFELKNNNSSTATASAIQEDSLVHDDGDYDDDDDDDDDSGNGDGSDDYAYGGVQQEHRSEQRRRRRRRRQRQSRNSRKLAASSSISSSAAAAAAALKRLPAAYVAYQTNQQPEQQHQQRHQNPQQQRQMIVRRDSKGGDGGDGGDGGEGGDDGALMSGASLVQHMLPINADGDGRRLVDRLALMYSVAQTPHRQALLGSEAFDCTVAFVDALAELGRRLIPVSKRDRNRLLREGLRAIDGAFLPSNALYLPFSVSSGDSGGGFNRASPTTTVAVEDGCRHRVFAIHADESSSFSTKERVPILVCVEVIDYGLAERQRRGLWAQHLDKQLQLKEQHQQQTLTTTTTTTTTAATTTTTSSLLSPQQQPGSGGMSGGGLLPPSSATKLSARLSRLASMVTRRNVRAGSIERDALVEDEDEENFLGRQRASSWGGESAIDQSSHSFGAGGGGGGYEAVTGTESGLEESGIESGFDSGTAGGGGRLGQWRTSAPVDHHRVAANQRTKLQNSLAGVMNDGGGGGGGGGGSGGGGGGGGGDDESDAPSTATGQSDGEDTEEEVGRINRSSRGRAVTLPVDYMEGSSDLLPAPQRRSETNEKAANRGGAAEGAATSAGQRLSLSAERRAASAADAESNYSPPLSEVSSEGVHMTVSPGSSLSPPPPVGPPPSRAVATCNPSSEGAKRSEHRRSRQQAERQHKPKVLFKEKWTEKEQRLRKASPIGHLPGWRLLPVIIKSNDDLRQEAFAAQLIAAMDRILTAEFHVTHGNVGNIGNGGGSSAAHPTPWLKPYGIVATSSDAGVIEAVPDTVSLDALKRNDPYYTNLLDFFQRYFPAAASSSPRAGAGAVAVAEDRSKGGGGGGGGGRGSKGTGREPLLAADHMAAMPDEQQLRSGEGAGKSSSSSSSSAALTAFVSFDEARLNFVRSLAPYCVACYLLQLKDRHNGNILLDAAGHIVHIDFGFLFLSSPGGNLAFESAPFKLTDEMVHLMGGPHSQLFKVFREVCRRTFLAFRRHSHQLTLLVDMMIDGHGDLPCWQGKPHEAAAEFRQRFQPQLTTDAAAGAFMNSLIDRSMNNWRTSWYDKYQRCCVGIF